MAGYRGRRCASRQVFPRRPSGRRPERVLEGRRLQTVAASAPARGLETAASATAARLRRRLVARRAPQRAKSACRCRGRAQTQNPAWSAGSRRRAGPRRYRCAQASAAPAGRSPRHRDARSGTTTPARPSLRAARPRNWRARRCRAACHPRNPGSAKTSARRPTHAPRPPTSAPRHWRGLRQCRREPAGPRSSADVRFAHRRRARCQAARRHAHCPRSKSRPR